jgi:hypothetical protein
MSRLHLTLEILAIMIIATGAAMAQTVGYAEAFDRFAIACGKDIDIFCKKTDLGGGESSNALIRIKLASHLVRRWQQIVFLRLD